MGYCYGSTSGKLVCDCCDTEGARKRACPYGWCKPAALCDACKRKVSASGQWKKAHCDCAAHAAEFDARNRREAALKESGAYVRCSALGVGDKVQVLFENKHGEVIGRLVSHETYDAIPLGEPATPEDYAKFGEVVETAGEYSNGTTTKQCTVEELA